jgi:hypothetical protein
MTTEARCELRTRRACARIGRGVYDLSRNCDMLRSMEEANEADQQLAKHFVGMVLRPASTLRVLGAQTKARPGASAVALLGIFWTGLAVLLWIDHHEPAHVLVPIPRSWYYLCEGLVLTPLLTGLWWLSSELAHRICARAKGEGSEAGTRAALGFAYAVPMLFAHVLPELVAYFVAGFGVLAIVNSITFGIAAIWVWALSAAALRVIHRVSVPIAIGASVVALMAQALVGALLIR